MAKTPDPSTKDAFSLAPEAIDDDAPFRARDSMGALRPSHADVDSAFARGYAQGFEEGEGSTDDRWRTVLCSILEARFGELDTQLLDRIEAADQKTMERWMVAAVSANSVEEVFSSNTKSNGARSNRHRRPQ